MSTIESPTLTAGTWAIEPMHSECGFTVRHPGMSKVRGRFNTFSGSATINDDLTAASVEAIIDLSSVDTNNPDRDGHLTSGDFFNAETHPQMTFVSTSATEDKLVGELTINGTTKTVELDVDYHGVAIDNFGMTRAGFSATGTIRRGDFGINFNAPLGMDGMLISDKVAIELEIQLVPAG